MKTDNYRDEIVLPKIRIDENVFENFHGDESEFRSLIKKSYFLLYPIASVKCPSAEFINELFVRLNKNNDYHFCVTIYNFLVRVYICFPDIRESFRDDYKFHRFIISLGFDSSSIPNTSDLLTKHREFFEVLPKDFILESIGSLHEQCQLSLLAQDSVYSILDLFDLEKLNVFELNLVNIRSLEEESGSTSSTLRFLKDHINLYYDYLVSNEILHTIVKMKYKDMLNVSTAVCILKLFIPAYLDVMLSLGLIDRIHSQISNFLNDKNSSIIENLLDLLTKICLNSKDTVLFVIQSDFKALLERIKESSIFSLQLSRLSLLSVMYIHGDNEIVSNYLLQLSIFSDIKEIFIHNKYYPELRYSLFAISHLLNNYVNGVGPFIDITKADILDDVFIDNLHEYQSVCYDEDDEESLECIANITKVVSMINQLNK